tara:strand:- start:118 stop:276 length:159 start_codon:yes stop_codon:yes gene_type:complete
VNKSISGKVIGLSKLLKEGPLWIFVWECFNVAVVQQNSIHFFSTSFNLLEIE